MPAQMPTPGLAERVQAAQMNPMRCLHSLAVQGLQRCPRGSQHTKVKGSGRIVSSCKAAETCQHIPEFPVHVATSQKKLLNYKRKGIGLASVWTSLMTELYKMCTRRTQPHYSVTVASLCFPAKLRGDGRQQAAQMILDESGPVACGRQTHFTLPQPAGLQAHARLLSWVRPCTCDRQHSAAKHVFDL